MIFAQPPLPIQIVFFGLNDPEKIGLTLNEPHRKSVNRENIKRFQRHGVISAKHVLVAQQIRKIGRKRIPDALIR